LVITHFKLLTVSLTIIYPLPIMHFRISHLVASLCVALGFLATVNGTIHFYAEVQDKGIGLTHLDAEFYDNGVLTCWFHGQQSSGSWGFSCLHNNIAMIANENLSIVLYARPGFSGQFRANRVCQDCCGGGWGQCDQYVADVW
jgi:hypothetical protein